MKGFKTIVIPTDFSENAGAALGAAVQLASELGAELKIVHVVPKSALREAVQTGILDADDTDETIVAKVDSLVRSKLDDLCEPFGDVCGLAERVILHGEPVRTLLEYVERTGADLIVVGRRGATFGDVVLGSVTERLVRNATCPVLVTPMTP